MTTLEAPPRAQCAGVSKRTGEQCQAPPVKGRDMCAGHLHLGISRDPATYQAQGAEAKRAAREAKKLGLTDVLALKLARDAEAIAENWTTEAKRDYRAAETALTRLYGKPKETVELTGGLDLTAMSKGERDELVRQALASSDVLELLPAEYQARLTRGA